MKQTMKYILALVAMILSTSGIMANGNATYIYKINGADAGNDNPGTVVYDGNGLITVTPQAGYYLTAADLTVVKMLDGKYAEVRRRAPGIDVSTIAVTAQDASADPSKETKYNITVTDTNYDYEITANFHMRTDISGATVTVNGGPYTYNGSAFKPDVTVALGGTTLTKGTDYDVYYADSINPGTGKIIIIGTRTYKGENTTATYTINKVAGSISYATTTIDKTSIEAPFTNPLTLTGDGSVSYASSNPSVATVDASGKVTIVGVGKTVITATVADGTFYTYTTKKAQYTLNVASAAMTVTASGYTGTYDGNAHGISVTAPDGATVKYGTAAGSYNLTASPTYTDAGTYTVYYQVTKANFTTVTGSQTVTISKAAATISFASAQVDKTIGDAAFTNALDNKGDGKVTYSSSKTSIATVDANGKVTIVGSGNATITATVADGTNYTYATKTASYQLKVAAAALSGVSATGYTGIYDGNAHGISVTAPAGATVRYGESDGTYNLDASPIYTNAGIYTVYYQVTKPNYTTVTGSETVTINKAYVQVQYVDYVFTTKMGETFNPPYLTLNPANLAVTYSSSDEEIATVDAQTGEVTLVSPGEVKIYAYFAGDANYNSALDYYILTVLQADIEPIDKDVVYTMDDDNFLYTDEDGNTQERKLDNTIIFDILFTLEIEGDPSESDGYDETEHCIVLNNPMSDSKLYNLLFMDIEPGSKEYAEEYTGLTFKVPAGKGYIIIDSSTDGEHWMKVQIGDLAPVSFCHTDREKDYILYECDKETWVHVYNGGLVNSVSMAPLHRAKKTKSQVRIYSITRSSSQAAGIERISSDVLESDRWYDLQGNKIQRPTKKGLYILDGQKVIVR